MPPGWEHRAAFDENINSFINNLSTFVINRPATGALQLGNDRADFTDINDIIDQLWLFTGSNPPAIVLTQDRE